MPFFIPGALKNKPHASFNTVLRVLNLVFLSCRFPSKAQHVLSLKTLCNKAFLSTFLMVTRSTALFISQLKRYLASFYRYFFK